MPPNSAGDRVLGLSKFGEEPGAGCLTHADAGVGNGNDDPDSRLFHTLAGDPHRHLSMLGEFHSVGDKVGEALTNPDAVA